LEGNLCENIENEILGPLRIDRQNPSLVNKTATEGSSVFWHCSVEEPGMEKGGIKFKWTKNGAEIGGQEIGLRAHLKVKILLGKMKREMN